MASLPFTQVDVLSTEPFRGNPLAVILDADVLTDEDPSRVVDLAWCDNGPGWVGVLLDDARTVLDLQPDLVGMGGWKIGVSGPYGDGATPSAGGPADVEVRAFSAFDDFSEDPVTGSLNASLAQWLIGNGTLPTRYVASQGTVLQRTGRVHLAADGADVWVGGAAIPTITGTITVG